MKDYHGEKKNMYASGSEKRMPYLDVRHSHPHPEMYALIISLIYAASSTLDFITPTLRDKQADSL
jgi:hypothetical protein